MNPLQIQNEQIEAQVHNSFYEIQSEKDVKKIPKIVNSSSRIIHHKDDNHKT